MSVDEYMENSEGVISEERETGKTGVFIVDKQSIFRQGLRQALSAYEDIEVIGDGESADDTWSIIEGLSPDVVLADVGIPALNGFNIARDIAIHCPRVAVVILSPEPDDDQLFEAIKSGAVAFAGKDIGAEELVTILRRVARGEYPINDSLLTRPSTARQVLHLFQSFAIKDIETLMTPLSLREMEILKYVAEGNPNKRIANALNISEQTIKNHITSIMRKLNANDRTHAVVLAVRNGWLSIDEDLDKVTKKEITRSI